MLEVSFEALRRVQLEEKKSPALAPLTDDFYAKYAGILREQQARLHANFSLDGASVHESMRRVLRDVWERRQHKIAVKALADCRKGENKAEGLANEEQRLYNALLTLLQRGDAEFAHNLGAAPTAPQPAVAENAAPAQPVKMDLAPELVRVRTLADLPAFMGPDGQSHGPFRAGQEVDLPHAAANLLQRRGAAQPIAPGAVATASPN